MTTIDLRAVKNCARRIKAAHRLARRLADNSGETGLSLSSLLADLRQARSELRAVQQREAKRQVRRADRKRRERS